MLTSTITPTSGVTVMVRPAIFLLIFVILIGRCYSQHLLIIWQMLLPLVLMLYIYNQMFRLMISGDVTTVVDSWLMLLP